MKQLSGLDASFLYMETPTMMGHVSGLAIYQRPTPDFDPFDLVYRRFEGMIGRLDPMRRRLVTVPLQLDHPYWIDDPEFDLDYHVRHLGLAPPGAADQLAEQVSRIVGRHMDRSRPLWECYVIEGLADGRWAMLTKTHHSTIDGASGVILLNMLTDLDPDAENTLEPVPWSGEPVPSQVEMLQTTMVHLASNPLKGLRVELRLVRDIASGAGLTSVVVRLSADDISGGVAAVEAAWRKISPQSPLQRRFVDDLFNENFEKFARLSQVFVGLTGFAFFISIIGLFGMAVQVAGRRIHEIGVRKSVGARKSQIVLMLLRDFSKPVLIANLIAWPLGYLAAQTYLHVFIQRIPITPLPFAASLAIVLVIAWAAVGSQAWRAARANPATVLRFE